jgi:hypothetical protein
MTDSDLIDALGGPARLAERLKLTPVKGRVQRVHNWRARGIPARIKLHNPEVFAGDLRHADTINSTTEETRDAA